MPVDFIKESEQFKGINAGVYHDNMQSAIIFRDMLTQWRIGANGITGLDYTALPVVMSFHDIDEESKKDVFYCIRTMENAVLKELNSR